MNYLFILTTFIIGISHSMEDFTLKNEDEDYSRFISDFFQNKDYFVLQKGEKNNEIKLSLKEALDPEKNFITNLPPQDMLGFSAPEGNYSKSNDIGYWAEQTFYTEEDINLVKCLIVKDPNLSENEKRKARNMIQGIKIHVSALPETALRIAKVVLPLLQEKKVMNKVLFHLPMMRYLYYVSPVKNTQAGKFITIYPQDIKEAQELLENLDHLLKSNNFLKTDFEPIIGDVEIGDTGGLFARYGSYSSFHIFKINEKGDLLEPQHEFSVMIKDDRTQPWPDYMNSKLQFPNSLFGSLKTSWKNIEPPHQIITWETRPDRWSDLLFNIVNNLQTAPQKKEGSISALLERLRNKKLDNKENVNKMNNKENIKKLDNKDN